jgi:mannan endo-1,4-beta-mannosidase
MRPRIVMLLAFIIAAVAVGFTGARFTLLPSSPPVVHASLSPGLDSYLGVFENGSPPSYQPIAEFAQTVGRQPNLVGYYSGWAEPFQASYAEMIRKHGVIPFVQIDPSLASVAAIAAGDYDIYLRTYADSVRNFGHAVVIGFGHEMNGNWYSWGYGNTPASTFIAAWQHIVTLFRAQGADNVTWLWTLQAEEPDAPGITGPVQDWWPGSSYVNWVGIDGYYYTAGDSFNKVFGKTIDEVRRFTNKPVLLSETAVGPDAGQALKIPNLFAGLRAYKTLGLVWFDKDKHQAGDILNQDWRIEGNPAAVFAFRLGVRDDLTAPRADP